MSDSCSRALAGAWLKAHLPNVAFQPWSAHVFSRRACVMMAASVRPNTLQLNKYIKTRAITINSASSGRSRLLFATKTRFVHFGWTRVCDQHPFVKKHKKHLFENNEKTHAEEARARMHDSNFVRISRYIRIVHSK